MILRRYGRVSSTSQSVATVPMGRFRIAPVGSNWGRPSPASATTTAAERPTLLPAAACDYTTGYLAAYGALLALARRAREGGSYHVRVSLCQSGMFIYRQGKVGLGDGAAELSAAELDELRIESQTHGGPLRHLGPVLRMSETPGRWDRPTPKLGSGAAVWL